MKKFDCYTTLSELFEHSVSREVYTKLTEGCWRGKDEEEPIHLIDILDNTLLEHALKCLAIPSLERLSRHVQAAYAERVLHIYEDNYPGDTRVRDQIAMLRNDEAEDDQRDTANRSAHIAAMDSGRDAPWEAARTSTEREVCSASWAALWAAASEAPSANTWATFWDAERAEQERILREMCVTRLSPDELATKWEENKRLKKAATKRWRDRYGLDT